MIFISQLHLFWDYLGNTFLEVVMMRGWHHNNRKQHLGPAGEEGGEHPSRSQKIVGTLARPSESHLKRSKKGKSCTAFIRAEMHRWSCSPSWWTWMVSRQGGDVSAHSPMSPCWFSTQGSCPATRSTIVMVWGGDRIKEFSQRHPSRYAHFSTFILSFQRLFCWNKWASCHSLYSFSVCH